MSLFAEPESSMVPFVCDPAISTALATGDDICSVQKTGLGQLPRGDCPKRLKQTEVSDEEGRVLKDASQLRGHGSSIIEGNQSCWVKIGESLLLASPTSRERIARIAYSSVSSVPCRPAMNDQFQSSSAGWCDVPSSRRVLHITEGTGIKERALECGEERDEWEKEGLS